MVCPATLVTYSRAVPLMLWNKIKFPTAIGVGPPGIVKQPAARVTLEPVGVITPAQTGTAGATDVTGAAVSRGAAAPPTLETRVLSAYRMVTISVLKPPVRTAPLAGFTVVTTEPREFPGITGGRVVYVTGGTAVVSNMLAAGVPGRTMAETPAAVFGTETPAAGIPSPACVRSRTMKCILARRFSWMLASNAT